MPICQMKTNYKMDEQIRKAFLSKTADLLSEILEKPLPAVMVMQSTEVEHILFLRSFSN